MKFKIFPLDYGPYSYGWWGIKMQNYGQNELYANNFQLVVSLGKWRRWDGYQKRSGVSLAFGFHIMWGEPQIEAYDGDEDLDRGEDLATDVLDTSPVI